MLWPRRGLALEVGADAPLNRYVFYSPGAEADFFCFEPVSHDIDAHNRASPQQAGLVALDEGADLRLSARFTGRPPWPTRSPRPHPPAAAAPARAGSARCRLAPGSAPSAQWHPFHPCSGFPMSDTPLDPNIIGG